jgi:hypothetical protein
MSRFLIVLRRAARTKATLALMTAAASIGILPALLPGSASAAASASFVKIDTGTAGNWIGAYAIDGYIVSQDANTKIPAYAQVTLSNSANWTWSASPGGVVALQRPENPSTRIAATWYASDRIFIDINFTDGNVHQFAFYALDWDSTLRAETINVRDAASNTILDSRIVGAGAGFQNGEYLAWNIRGHVQYEIIKNAGANAVISGMFFGGAPVAVPPPTSAVPVNTFLSSLGVDTHMEQGYPEPPYEPMFRYTGIRNVREGCTPGTAAKLVTLHSNTGVLASVGGSNMTNLISTAQTVAASGGLLSLEGPNEPNNFKVTYNGQTGGGSGTWLPVAQFQRDLYTQVKASAALKNYPVFSVSEGGAEVDNVGLQFLTIPAGATTTLPAGTKFADYANPHNYVTGRWRILNDNQAWNAADPILRGALDGLAVEYGVTWGAGYSGYSDTQLATLPRITSETGWNTTGPGALTEAQQGKLFLNVYLAQFKRGWRYTFIYQMVDNQGGDTLNMGLFHTDTTPKLSATYIHNLTAILADTISKTPGVLNYSVPAEPATVHDFLMQKSDGTFYLAVWDERAAGAVDNVTVNLAAAHASVKVYDPTAGTAAIRTLTNVSSIPLTLSDHPQILAISNP